MSHKHVYFIPCSAEWHLILSIHPRYHRWTFTNNVTLNTLIYVPLHTGTGSAGNAPRRGTAGSQGMCVFNLRTMSNSFPKWAYQLTTIFHESTFYFYV